MTKSRENVVPHAKVRSLRDAIRKVRMAEVERTDVVVELQESERARLELLAEELQDVFQEVPEDDDQFSFQIVPGSIPRLWIDITSHVVMGRDKRTYRFVKDTRLGRTVILEATDISEMAECITTYVAERIVERERALEGDWLVKRAKRETARPARKTASEAVAAARAAPDRDSLGWIVAAFLLGILIGVAVLLGWAWVQVG